MDESIYSLIQPEVIPKQKALMFRSQFPGVIAPTGSTFNNKTTINHGINNISGSMEISYAPYSYKNESATFGRPSKLNRYSSQQLKPILLKKNQSIMGNNSLDYLIKGSTQRSISAETRKQIKTKLKPIVPILHSQPKIATNQMEKNFIMVNAVETMISKPKLQKEDVDYLKKSDYGKVPRYLSQVKQSITEEYDLAQSKYIDQEQMEEQKKYLLPQKELEELKLGLKTKYDIVNQKYQLMTHQLNMDTVGLRRRKEMYEKELIQIEKDLEKLSKNFVFIDVSL